MLESMPAGILVGFFLSLFLTGFGGWSREISRLQGFQDRLQIEFFIDSTLTPCGRFDRLVIFDDNASILHNAGIASIALAHTLMRMALSRELSSSSQGLDSASFAAENFRILLAPDHSFLFALRHPLSVVSSGSTRLCSFCTRISRNVSARM